MTFTVTVLNAGTFDATATPPASFVMNALFVPGPQGPTGATGPAGVVAATAPITYNAGTQTVGIDQSGFLLKSGNLAGLADLPSSRLNLGLGSAAVAASGDFAAAVHTHTASQISDSTTAGRALLTAADAAAQRTSLGLGSMALATAADYLDKAGNLSGLADVAASRGNLGLGTMALATASDYLSKAQNLSGLSDLATARSNLGLGTMATETAANYYLASNPAGYVTASTAPVTSVAGKTGAVSLAVADVSGAAPLASPAFTGNPTAPTPATSDNDTSIATTAFVNAYVPAASTTTAGKVELATILEAHTGSSGTLAVTPDDLAFRIHSGSTLYLNPASATSTVSSGSTFTSSQGMGVRTGTASGSYGMLSFGGNTTNGFSATVANDSVVNFAKRMIFSGKAQVRSASDAGNYVQRVQFGKTQTTTPIGNLGVAGVGFRCTGAGNAVVLMVHNGTTLTTVTSSFTPTAAQAFDFQIHSNGSGNVTLYVNGSSVATSSAGPTGDSSSLPCVTVETEATASIANAANSSLLVCNLRVSFDL